MGRVAKGANNVVGLDAPMKYFNEYLYFRMVQQYNSEHASEPVKKRQAIQFRDNLTEALQKRGKTIADAGPSVMLESMNEVFKEGTGNDCVDAAAWNAGYKASMSQFSSLTGMATTGGQRGSKVEFNGLPLSPYDPQLSMREAFLEAGNNLLYAKAEDLNFASDGLLTADNMKVVMGKDLTLYSAKMGDIQQGQLEAGTALSDGDLSGYSLLSTLVPERNAREIRAWCVQEGNPNPVYSDPAEVRKAYQVLAALKDEGIPFELKRDERPGQIKAKVMATGMPSLDVRVLDPMSPQYGGCSRIYMEGVQGYYSTDKQEKRQNPETGAMEMQNAPYIPTVQERVDLIKFAMGQQVLRGDGKPVGTFGTYRDRNGLQNESYHSGKSFSAMVRPYPGDANSKVFMRLVSTSPSDMIRFRTPEDSDKYLMDAIETAREGYTAQFDVEGLIKEAQDHKDEPEYEPAWHEDPYIAGIQEQYWKILTGEEEELLMPGATSEDYAEAVATLDESGLTGTSMEEFVRKGMVYEGTPEQKVRLHFDDLVENDIGSFTPDLDGKRFNPVAVSKYMMSGVGQYRNTNDIVSALRSSRIKADSLKGDEFYNKTIADALIEFDQASSRQMRFEQSPFMKSMYEAVKSAVAENGCQVDDRDILIDDNGVVEYRATRLTSKGATAKGRKDVVGHIGQIFEPDEKGLVTTKFAGSANYKFAPGMTADVVPNKPGENLPYEQRVKIKTYEMAMRDGIRNAVRSDMMNDYQEVGGNTSLNNIVRRNQGVRFAEGELEAKPETLREAIIAAETGRVVFSNEITQNAGRYDIYRYEHDEGIDRNDDMHMDAIQLMGGQNFALLRPEESAGIFDARATGTGPAQGNRYLVKGAMVGMDGRIIPAMNDDGSISADAQNGLSAYIDAHHGQFDAIDRYDMTVTALRHCKDVQPANVAQMAFGGWGHGDAIVVSKEWADAHGIHNKGDKLSDFHGNKGVVSLIVDRDMDLAEAEKQGLAEPVKWFRANPELDMVMSPYSAVSRFNGGLYREALENVQGDLVSPDGSVAKGGISKLDMIIMEQTADKKSTDFTDEEEVQQSSRNFGGQTGWSLGANGALNILKEGFEGNSRSVVNFRELLIMTGMDLSETGEMRVGYHPHEGEERHVFEMQEMVLKTKRDRESGERVPDIDSKTGRQKIDYNAMKAAFGREIDKTGGFMELPFPVKFPEGKAAMGGQMVDMGWTPEIPEDMRSEASKELYSGKTYAVPVMSPFMRSGQEFEDGTSSVHDYTSQYLRLYECGVKYRDLEANGASKEDLDRVMAQGQQEYNKMTDDIIARKFSGKRNVIRTSLLGAKQPAVTMVVTPDPRLDLEEVAINPELAKAMRLKEGDSMLTWRDPLLTRTGMSCNKVKFDETQRCMSIPPHTNEDKDSDHDGDTWGGKKVNTPEAKAEAEGCMSILTRLLKTGQPADAKGEYELSLDSGEEQSAVWAKRPEFKGMYDDLKHRVNILESRAKQGRISEDVLAVQRKTALSSVNGYVHAMLDASYGLHPISYESPEACLKSIEEYVNDGVKGSSKKLDTFARFAGFSYERGADGKIDYSTLHVADHTLVSEEEALAPLDARNMQQAYTGPAGGQTIQSMVYASTATDRDFSKGLTGRKVTAAEIMDATTATTKNVTQAVLQVKHSASQAHQMEDVIQAYLSPFMAGYKMERVEDGSGVPAWKKAKDENGRPYQCTLREFKEQLFDVYENGLGVAVIEEKVNIIADFLTDEKTGRIKTMEQRRKEAPPLQRMAYDGSGDNGFATVQQMAAEGRSLYEGSPNLNEAMIPKRVRNNIEAKAFNATLGRELNFLEEFSLEQQGIDPDKREAKQVQALVETRERESAGKRRAVEAAQAVTVRREAKAPELAEASADDGMSL